MNKLDNMFLDYLIEHTKQGIVEFEQQLQSDYVKKQQPGIHKLLTQNRNKRIKERQLLQPLPKTSNLD